MRGALVREPVRREHRVDGQRTRERAHEVARELVEVELVVHLASRDHDLLEVRRSPKRGMQARSADNTLLVASLLTARVESVLSRSSRA